MAYLPDRQTLETEAGIKHITENRDTCHLISLQITAVQITPQTHNVTPVSLYGPKRQNEHRQVYGLVCTLSNAILLISSEA